MQPSSTPQHIDYRTRQQNSPHMDWHKLHTIRSRQHSHLSTGCKYPHQHKPNNHSHKHYNKLTPNNSPLSSRNNWLHSRKFDTQQSRQCMMNHLGSTPRCRMCSSPKLCSSHMGPHNLHTLRCPSSSPADTLCTCTLLQGQSYMHCNPTGKGHTHQWLRSSSQHIHHRCWSWSKCHSRWGTPRILLLRRLYRCRRWGRWGSSHTTDSSMGTRGRLQSLPAHTPHHIGSRGFSHNMRHSQNHKGCMIVE